MKWWCKMAYIKGSHEFFMKEALKEAEKAYKKGEIPVGAVIVKDSKVIARGHNEKEIKNNPINHAEISAIQKACKKLGSWRLYGCSLYVTLEPCPMCAGALIQARLDRVVIGTPDPKAGAVGSVIDILADERFNHKVEACSGVLQDECAQILKKFFMELREGMHKNLR
jgi:tRNA(adenine34) deaminase